MNIKNGLVKSAFDFLNRSIDVLEDHPKYSIIFLTTSLELFIKAKLAEEHWTLLIEDPTSANIDKLKSGKFKSVSLSDGIERIENILNEHFSKSQKALFETIVDHRNQIIHFYHKDFSKSSDEKMVEKALRDLSEGWYYLSNILNSKNWKVISSGYSSEMKQVNKKLKQKGHLLKGKFHSLSEVLKKQNEDGKEIKNCKICNFESAVSTSIVENLLKCNCLVCESQYKTIELNCPQCQEKIFTEEFGTVKCTNCGHLTDFDDIVDLFCPTQRRHDEYLDTPAYCTTCEFVDASVVPINDKYVCINCFDHFQELDQCDYCGTHCSGYLEYSYLSGCVVCEGKFADIENE